MRTILMITGWSLRASALICIVWTGVQVANGQVDSVRAILEAAAFHGVFALSGVQLVGLARRRQAAEFSAQHPQGA